MGSKLIKKEVSSKSPTLEEFITFKIDNARETALEKSRTRTVPAWTLKENIMSEEEWLDSFKKRA
jgi:hypothetical protein